MTDEDGWHCHGECANTYDDDGELLDEGDNCAHCDCCCECLGCIYAPRDSVPMTAEQRAPIAAMTFDRGDVPPNAGELVVTQTNPEGTRE